MTSIDITSNLQGKKIEDVIAFLQAQNQRHPNATFYVCTIAVKGFDISDEPACELVWEDLSYG